MLLNATVVVRRRVWAEIRWCSFALRAAGTINYFACSSRGQTRTADVVEGENESIAVVSGRDQSPRESASF